jgi:hypothetical protein
VRNVISIILNKVDDLSDAFFSRIHARNYYLDNHLKFNNIFILIKSSQWEVYKKYILLLLARGKKICGEIIGDRFDGPGAMCYNFYNLLENI